jgi:hypothetical protein
MELGVLTPVRGGRGRGRGRGRERERNRQGRKGRVERREGRRRS